MRTSTFGFGFGLRLPSPAAPHDWLRMPWLTALLPATWYQFEYEAANAQVIVAKAAAVVAPRAAWWACGLLLEEGRSLEGQGELAEARRRYVAAAG